MEKKIIIADCGGTSADWAMIRGEKIDRFRSEGFNASAVTGDEIISRLAPVTERLSGADEIRFYGAGCRPGAPTEAVKSALHHLTGCIDITVGSDLEAAIQAVAPEGEAIVSILGTGSNSCRTSDGTVINRVRSAGYILGDWGSGAAMGRELMGEYIAGRIPPQTCIILENRYGLTPDLVIEHTYRGERPNAWLGSFAPFLAENITDPFIRAIVSRQMQRFVNYNIIPLIGNEPVTCHFVGSIASNFGQPLRRAMKNVGEVGDIIASPLDAIVRRIQNQL